MSTTVNPKTFPGFYSQITDDSFVQPASSRFRPGLVGVATKGSFNTATAVRSLKEFRRTFGAPLASYDSDGVLIGNGFFLADAVAILADLTDGVTVVRVGSQYTEFGVTDISGVAGYHTFGTSQASLLSTDDYVRITQPAKHTSLNLRVTAAGNRIPNVSSSGTVVLDASGAALADTYIGATLAYSRATGAANKAESILYAYSYGTTSTNYNDHPITEVGEITGNKNEYTFLVTQGETNIVIGGVYKIKDPLGAKATTPEVRVKDVQGKRVYLETSDLTKVGYQALPLQDSYAVGEGMQLCRAQYVFPYFYLEAASEGTWANGANSAVGLYVKVLPGSAAGTKKLEIYENAALVETFDNLSSLSSSVDWYETRINGISQYISIKYTNQLGTNQQFHPANTANPWDSAYLDQNLALDPKTMPQGAVNAGDKGADPTGGNFENGADGANPTDADYIGTIDPEDDTPTGLKCFEDTENVNVNVIAAPMQFDSTIGLGVMQEMARVARKINAMAIADVPRDISARMAIDWHNGAGKYSYMARIDRPNLAVYWNWFNITDAFTGAKKMVPPTLAALRCMAFTFDRDKPWYAAAGETRGWVPEALSVQYPRVPEDVKQAMYGNGQSVNPILKLRNNRIVIYGERTLQIAESKLTAIHNVILVNYIVNGLAEIGRRYVFDPNDAELLVLIRLAFSEFLDKVRNERGLEAYDLVIDDRNNNADTRNQRQVIVDLAVIPTDVAERIFLNCTVKESGAVLDSLNA